MKPELFGTDGLRGIGFKELDAKLAFNIGKGLKEALNAKEVVIGMDTRDSSPMLAHMVAAGALSVGIDVLFAGVVSTPMIAHYSKLNKIAGIMITASHNPYTDNGIKVFNKGYKSSTEEELIIESYIRGKEIKSDFTGIFSLTDDVEKEYFKLIEKLELKGSNIKLVYDSANGANHLISNKIMEIYFPKSIQINNTPNGKNINLNSGSTSLEAIKKFILENKMDLGFAYDGDGDRVIMLDNNGTIYDGDFIIYIVSKYLKKLGTLNKNHVVLTKMSNPGILKALKESNIDYVLTDVGDKYVHKALVDNDYTIGGEASGHIILRHILHSGDGLLASLYILKMLEEKNIDLITAVKDVSLYPLKMVNIKNVNKLVLNEDKVKDYLDTIKKEFDSDDIFLVRASGTENLIRVTISCKDIDKLDKYMNDVTKFIKKEGKI